MAEREVRLEFVFDRRGEQAIASAYRVLVPERVVRATPSRGSDNDDQAGSSAGLVAASPGGAAEQDLARGRSVLGA